MVYFGTSPELLETIKRLPGGYGRLGIQRVKFNIKKDEAMQVDEDTPTKDNTTPMQVDDDTPPKNSGTTTPNPHNGDDIMQP